MHVSTNKLNVFYCRPVYLLPERNTHGKKLDNGSWNGLMGLLDRNEADVSPESISMTPSRTKAGDFVVPFKKNRS